LAKKIIKSFRVINLKEFTMIVLVKSVDCKNLKFSKDKLDKQTIQWLSFVCGDRNEMKRILTKKKNNMAILLRMGAGIDQLKNETKDVMCSAIQFSQERDIY